MDLSAPVGAEAVGDLPEDDRRGDFPLGDVVGGRDVAVGHEDEELCPPGLDLSLEHLAGRMGDGGGDEMIEPVVGLGGVGGQGGVLQPASSLAHADRPSQVIADLRGEDRVAAVDGVLHVAQDMSQADLMAAAQLLLAGVAVGDPHIGLVPGQDLIGDTSGPAGRDLVEDSLVGEEHPLPVGGTAHPGGGLVRRDDPTDHEDDPRYHPAIIDPRHPVESGKYGSIRRICASVSQIKSPMTGSSRYFMNQPSLNTTSDSMGPEPRCLVSA